MKSIEERFLVKVKKQAGSGCWLWQGCLSPEGYARLSINNCATYAHHWSYEHYVGPIPPGMFLNHLCRKRRCVNPAHLEPVPQSENSLRGLTGLAKKINREGTKCINGHPWTAANTYVRKNGQRFCRRCNADRMLRMKQMQRAAMTNYDSNSRV